MAMAPDTARILRIAGASVTPRNLAATMEQLTGQRSRLVGPGGAPVLGAMIRAARVLAPQPGAVFPASQGMQYLRGMMDGSGKLEPLDISRYPGLRWTGSRRCWRMPGLPRPGQ